MQVFVENPEVMAITGLVIAYELKTDSQVLFEKYGGFGKGFLQAWYRTRQDPENRAAWRFGTGAIGTGADMAFRRQLFETIGKLMPDDDVCRVISV
jgi:O-antigen biosynthesis protein